MTVGEKSLNRSTESQETSSYNFLSKFSEAFFARQRRYRHNLKSLDNSRSSSQQVKSNV